MNICNLFSNTNASNLYGVAEICINNMELAPEKETIIRSWISKYALPDSFCDRLRWVVYVTIDLVKDIFGVSEREFAKSVIRNHLLEKALAKKIILQSPSEELDVEMKHNCIDLFATCAREFLQTLESVQNRKLQNLDASTDESDRFAVQNVSLQKILGDLEIVKSEIEMMR